jgi:predicted oxidoreductase
MASMVQSHWHNGPCCELAYMFTTVCCLGMNSAADLGGGAFWAGPGLDLMSSLRPDTD